MPKGAKFGGRQKGSSNKTTASAKAAIEWCFEAMGGRVGLKNWAEKNPTDFYKVIYPKILPLTLANDDDKPLTITINYPK